MFIKYIEEWVANNTKMLMGKKIKVEHILNYENKKLELGLSNMVNNNGGSFELLKNGTCDLLIIDFKTDETIFYETLVFKNIDELTIGLNRFISNLEQTTE